MNLFASLFNRYFFWFYNFLLFFGKSQEQNTVAVFCFYFFLIYIFVEGEGTVKRTIAVFIENVLVFFSFLFLFFFGGYGQQVAFRFDFKILFFHSRSNYLQFEGILRFPNIYRREKTGSFSFKIF